MSFWNTWDNPNTNEIVELYAYEQWQLTVSKLPKGWNKNCPVNWDKDSSVNWAIIGLEKSAENYMEAKLKTEIKSLAESFGSAFGAWTGALANGEVINLNIDNLDSEALTDTITYDVVSEIGLNGETIQHHTVVIEKGLIKSWGIT